MFLGGWQQRWNGIRENCSQSRLHCHKPQLSSVRDSQLLSGIDQTPGDSTRQSSNDAHVPKLISDKKLAANRRNAQKSTGPKTREGKRRSSMNATKSGTFMSKAMIFDGGLGQEQADELSELIEALREDWQPNSTEEELLVEERGIYRWRRRRNFACETAEISLRSRRIVEDDLRARRKRFETDRRSLPNRDGLDRLKASTLGIAFLIDELRAVLEEVSPTGKLKRDSVQRLSRIYGAGSGTLTEQSKRELGKDPAAVNRRGHLESGDSLGSSLTNNSAVLRRYPAIGDELWVLENRMALAVSVEHEMLSMRISPDAFPHGDLSRNILRWETTFRNLESRSLTELIQVRKIDLRGTDNHSTDGDDSDEE